MKKLNNTDLINRIDWDNIMKMPRYAGGHDEQMQGLLKDSTVISHWNEGDYQGEVATILYLNDTKQFVMYTDYYGSCCGCDAWEDASDNDVVRMCIQLASTAKIFDTINEASEFLTTPRESGKDFEYSDIVRKGLIKNIMEGITEK